MKPIAYTEIVPFKVTSWVPINLLNNILWAWLQQNKPSRECQEVQYELHGLDVSDWVCYLSGMFIMYLRKKGKNSLKT